MRSFNDFIVNESINTGNTSAESDSFLDKFLYSHEFSPVFNECRKFSDNWSVINVSPDKKFYDNINVIISQKDNKTECSVIFKNRFSMDYLKDFVVFSQNLEKLMKDISKINIAEHLIIY